MWVTWRVMGFSLCTLALGFWVGINVRRERKPDISVLYQVFRDNGCYETWIADIMPKIKQALGIAVDEKP